MVSTSDFNEPGKAFGLKELLDARQRGAIVILDDRTIADMKAKRQRDRERDEAQRQQEAVAAGEQTDWKEAMKQWEDWEAQEIAKIELSAPPLREFGVFLKVRLALFQEGTSALLCLVKHII